MTYYIFLKSLGSLEEFRKNPHIKIPPKSPPINFQSLGIFKNPIFILKQIFLQLLAQSAQQPVGLLAHPAQLPSACSSGGGDPFEIVVTELAGEDTQAAQQLPQNDDNEEEENNKEEKEEGNKVKKMKTTLLGAMLRRMRRSMTLMRSKLLEMKP
jgi:hypothetical protein